VSGASAPPQPQIGRSTGAAGATGASAQVDSCPLCGAPLRTDQDWCLRCGAAARTRLATSPNWKAPIIAVAVVWALSLAVLAAALVKLAGNSGSTKIHITGTVTTPAAVTSPSTATPTPAPSSRPPAASTPAASTPATATPVALAPVTRVTPTIVVLTGAVNPQGVPTTFQFQYGTSTRYGSAVPAMPGSAGAGTAPFGVAWRIEYLAPGTTYHYRLTATKAGHAISTADATFTTPR
jgi:hypothetical protein